MLTTLFNPVENYNPGVDDKNINLELNKVYDWLCANKLSVNVKKTKFMVFHSTKKCIENKIPNLTLNNSQLQKVSEFNFLGITLNENMKWQSHINRISNKMSRYIGIINKLKHFLPQFILKTLYDTMILSQLNYGILNWGFNVEKLYKLQKKAIRIITGSKYNAHTEPLFKSLGTLKVEDIFQLNILKFYYNHCHNELPLYLQSIKFDLRSDKI